MVGFNDQTGDTDVVAILNSQRNMVVEYGNLEKLSTVLWDGRPTSPLTTAPVCQRA